MKRSQKDVACSRENMFHSVNAMEKQAIDVLTNFRATLSWCKTLLFLAGLLVIAGCGSVKSTHVDIEAVRIQELKGTFGTYDAEPRKPDGRVDVDRLVNELVAIKANTYNFLVWRAANDWEDFKLFLPKAREHNIKVWITLCPPSESPPRTKKFSEPFRLDYIRWAEEIATLSLQEPNLVAWSLDDFAYNSKTFTPEYMTEMIGHARKINPRLAFVPCLYYHQVTPGLGAKYGPYVDGILFPYRHEAGKANLTQWDTLEPEIDRIRSCFGSRLPVFVDVYATKHSRLSNSSPQYVEQVMKISRKRADGVLIYCHQYEESNPEKYHVIKALFEDWAAEGAGRAAVPK